MDELFLALATTNDAWAEGAALYSVGGMFDVLRKAKLDERAEAIRATFAQRGEKVTEACITQAAHADSEYSQFLERHRVARVAWHALDAQRQYNRLQIVARMGEDADADELESYRVADAEARL
jgi:hypothetical protein